MGMRKRLSTSSADGQGYLINACWEIWSSKDWEARDSCSESPESFRLFSSIRKEKLPGVTSTSLTRSIISSARQSVVASPSMRPFSSFMKVDRVMTAAFNKGL